MRAMYDEKNKENEALRIDLENQLTEIDRKIKRLEERYIMEEIDRDLFSRFKSQFLEERSFLTEQAVKSQKGSSNLESCLKSAVRYSRKLATTWAFGDFNEKQALQKMLFPRGISYNREKDQVRTSDINTVFLLIAKLSGGWDQKKVRGITFESNSAHSVEPAGFEPASKQVYCKLSTCLFLN